MGDNRRGRSVRPAERVVLVVAVAVLGMGLSCETKNIGGDGPPVPRVDVENYLRGSTPRIDYNGPATVETGGVLEFQGCVKDPSGRPVTGVEWYFTLGDPPSHPDASHTRGTLDHTGCIEVSLPVDLGPPTKLWTSDGDRVFEVADFAG